MKLTIIRGLPGSGKSTKAKSLNILHIEADMYHMKNGKYEFNYDNVKLAHEWCQRAAWFAFMNGVEFVVSNTFITFDEIQPYLEIAKIYKYEVEIIRMTNDYGNTHDVPKNVLDSMQERFEDVEGEVIYVNE